MKPANSIAGNNQLIQPPTRYEVVIGQLRSSGGFRKELALATSSDQKDKKVVLPPKRYWHVYSLQSLQAEKLTKIVNKVLQREYVLIK